jgi:glycosyltransferase involved in cell wall biosynthesis
MNAGLPIVSTAVGGTVEEIEDGVSGRLVKPGDAGAMAAAITGLLSSPGEAARMAAKARERVTTLFSLDRMVSDTEAFYHEGGR